MELAGDVCCAQSSGDSGGVFHAAFDEAVHFENNPARPRVVTFCAGVGEREEFAAAGNVCDRFLHAVYAGIVVQLHHIPFSGLAVSIIDRGVELAFCGVSVRVDYDSGGRDDIAADWADSRHVGGGGALFHGGDFDLGSVVSGGGYWVNAGKLRSFYRADLRQ